MIVRVVEERDFDAIAAITNPYILETSIHFASEPVTGDELRDQWVEGRDRYPMFVAEVDGVDDIWTEHCQPGAAKGQNPRPTQKYLSFIPKSLLDWCEHY